MPKHILDPINPQYEIRQRIINQRKECVSYWAVFIVFMFALLGFAIFFIELAKTVCKI